MSMKLWIIKPTEKGRELLADIDWDHQTVFIVRAATEEIACDEVCERADVDLEDSKFWNDSDFASCEELTANGETEILYCAEATE